MATDANTLGKRGEGIVFLALTELYGKRPYFRPFQLDDKWPVADFVVELEGRPGRIFLLQVKSTQRALRTRSVPIDFDKDRLAKLLGASIPAYVVGVHEPSKSAYIAVPRVCARLRAVPTTHDLAARKTLIALRDEVTLFWKQQTKFRRSNSVFVF